MSRTPEGKPCILFIASNQFAARFYRGQLRWFASHGFRVALLTSPGEDLDLAGQEEGVETVGIPFRNEISPLHDLVTLWHLFRQMRRLRPAIVHASIIKGALLGLIMATLLRVPVRIYYARGCSSETATGVKRILLLLCHRLTYYLADRAICDSHSLQRLVTAKMGLVSRRKTTVFRAGSCNGFSADEFCITPERLHRALCRREQLGLTERTFVIGYVGRIQREKGIANLVRACQCVFSQHEDVVLLMVGKFWNHGLPDEDTIEQIRTNPRIIHVDHTRDVVPHYMLMDVLVLPSYREGFGNVAVEASLSDVPVIGTRVTGVVDSVADGVSGTLVPLEDSQALAGTIFEYLRDPKRRRRLGRSGRLRGLRDFTPELIWQDTYNLFRELLREKCPHMDVLLTQACSGRKTLETCSPQCNDLLARRTDLMAALKYHVLKGVSCGALCEEFDISLQELQGEHHLLLKMPPIKSSCA